MVLSKRVVGARQKNRRGFPKESTMLFKRIDGAKRKQSIYSQISLNCYISGGNNTGPKDSRIIVFPLGFREVFSLLPSCLWIHLEQHHRDGRFRKNFVFFEEMQSPYEDSCNSLSHLCHGKGMCFPIHLNCYNVWTESFKTIPTPFLLSRVLRFSTCLFCGFRRE